MQDLLAALRACAEPTRLRLLALAARGAFCVVEFTEILGQSQPRLSRHLRLLCDAGLLERSREGANVWFTLAGGPGASPVASPDASLGASPDASPGTSPGAAARPRAPGGLARGLLARLPPDDPVLLADRRHAARVLAERARVASDSFRREGRDWDEMRALGLPAAAVERALLSLLPAEGLGRVLDVGTGTGRLLELLGPRAEAALGVDASRAMLALARARLAELDLPGCAVRLGDMYRLGLPAGGFDLAVLQMVLHHAEDPAAALAEAARCLRPGGRLLVVELAAHGGAGRPQERALALAHRWPGFTDAAMAGMLRAAGLRPLPPLAVPGTGAGAPPGPHPAPDPEPPPSPGGPDARPAPGGLCVRVWAADAPPHRPAGVSDAARPPAAADRPPPAHAAAHAPAHAPAVPAMRTRA